MLLSGFMSSFKMTAMTVMATLTVVLTSALTLDTGVANATTSMSSATIAHKRSVALSYALRQRGCWYRYGGAGPCSRGYDCSGLVMRAYGKAGVWFAHYVPSIRHSSRLRQISKSQARNGDLVFWGDEHVGFYYRGGRLDANHPGSRVAWRPLFYWSGEPMRFYTLR